MTLLRRLAAIDVGFGERSDKAWRLVLDRATRRDEPSSYEDAMTAAMNRGQTRAVEALFTLMGWEHRTSGSLCAEALQAVDAALRVAGVDGEQHRAMIVPRLPFLVAVAPDWVAERRELIFGDAAPAGLAQVAVDLFLRWGRPNRWFFEAEREALRDAVRRDAHKATSFWLVAMLWRIKGYGVPATVDLFAGLGDERLSTAAEGVGRLLRGTDVDPELTAVGVTFADELLRRNRPHAVAGLGSFTEIESLDDQTWLDVTERAGRLAPGPLTWSGRVAERAAMTRSIQGLRILNDVVLGVAEAWDSATVTRSALAALRDAAELRDTDDYRKLRSTLLDRGVFGAEEL